MGFGYCLFVALYKIKLAVKRREPRHWPGVGSWPFRLQCSFFYVYFLATLHYNSGFIILRKGILYLYLRVGEICHLPLDWMALLTDERTVENLVDPYGSN